MKIEEIRNGIRDVWFRQDLIKQAKHLMFLHNLKWIMRNLNRES